MSISRGRVVTCRGPAPIAESRPGFLITTRPENISATSDGRQAGKTSFRKEPKFSEQALKERLVPQRARARSRTDDRRRKPARSAPVQPRPRPSLLSKKDENKEKSLLCGGTAGPGRPVGIIRGGERKRRCQQKNRVSPAQGVIPADTAAARAAPSRCPSEPGLLGTCQTN